MALTRWQWWLFQRLSHTDRKSINRSTPPELSPLRITEIPAWREQHQNIADEIWQHPDVNFQGNCGACHLDAELGTFEDGALTRIPRDPHNHPRGEKLMKKYIDRILTKTSFLFMLAIRGVF